MIIDTYPNDFSRVVDKAISSGNYKNRQAVANAMKITKQKMSGYYHGKNQPSVKKAIEMFNAVGYDVQVIELIN